jgi:DNA-directed RNA polymerase specialized sigma24 family protein
MTTTFPTGSLGDKVTALTSLVDSLNPDRHLAPADYLQILRFASETAQSALRSAVAMARAEGMSWDEIGRWLGVSRQAAWERYGA